MGGFTVPIPWPLTHASGGKGNKAKTLQKKSGRIAIRPYEIHSREKRALQISPRAEKAIRVVASFDLRQPVVVRPEHRLR